MKAEIVITGLCSMLNPEGKNSTMGDPSFIAVQTPHCHIPGYAVDHHVAYLAFDSTKVRVDSASGFMRVPQALQFLYLPLNGVEIAIGGLLPGLPLAGPSYAKVVRKDDYWPEAKDQWNRDYVPQFGDKPKKAAAKAWMRFGGGDLSADRISKVQWEFTRKDGTKYADYFAEEIVYTNFIDPSASELVIEIQDLEAGASVTPRRLRFTPVRDGGAVTLIIGNNIKSDMAGAVKRLVTVTSAPGDHFKYMNAVAGGGHVDGPIPVPVHPSPSSPSKVGGGENSGPCGPGSGNN
jgi:hypothetical protein